MSAAAEFARALAEAGIPCSEPIVVSGTIVRYRTTLDHKPNCWYVLFGEETTLVGVFGCFKRGLNIHWSSSQPTHLSGQELRKAKAMRSRLTAERDAKVARMHAEASAVALAQWERAKPADTDHPYLRAKGIGSYGIRILDRNLLLPLRDGTEIRALQTISTKGDKLFSRGGEIRGNFFLFGTPSTTIYLCEGYATGASVYEATGQPFALVFSCHNMQPVAQKIRELFPNAEIIVCADDDWRTAGNPGKKAALEAARAIRSKLALPRFKGERGEKDTDFNDLHRLEGISAVRDSLEAAEIPGLGPLAQILEQIEAVLRRYIFLPSEAEFCAVTLWVAHTWAFDHADTSPILAITSAERSCGKTRLFEILQLLCRNAWSVIGPSEAVLFRKIEADCPTVLLDETDTIFGRNSSPSSEGIRAILNAGNRRGATVPRTEPEGKKFVLRDFETFCPKAVAGIGELPDTVTSRAIPIRMKKRTRSEPISRFRFRDARAEIKPITEALEIWADHFSPCELGNSDLPDELSDRAQEGWILPIQIATAAGDEWLHRAKASAIALHDGREDDVPVGAQLLKDIQGVFAETDANFLSTQDLLTHLNSIEESGWADRGRDGLTAGGLARLLKPYGIKPYLKRLGGMNGARGYERSDFEDSWQRFCAPFSDIAVTSVTTLQSESDEPSSGPALCNAVTVVTVSEGKEGSFVRSEEVRF